MGYQRRAMTTLVAVGTGIVLAGFHAAALADAPPETLRFLTTPQTAEVKVALDRAALIQDIVFEATQAQTGMRVEVTHLTGAADVDLTCSIDGASCDKAFDMAAGDARTVRLTATIDMAGTYHAVIGVKSGATRKSMMLTVERAETPFPLESAARVETTPANGSTLNVNVTVQEKLGRDATLNAPVVSLSHRETGKTALEGANFTSSLTLDGKPLAAPWTMTRREAKTIVAALSGLHEAGEYVGSMRFTSPDTAQLLDIPLLITVKDSGLTAAVLIGFGVLISFALGLYVRGIRPKLVQQRAAARLEGDLRTLLADLETQFGELQDDERAVVEALAARLDDLAQSIESGTAANVEGVLAEIDLKLSLVRRWINAKRRLNALTTPPPELQDKIAAVRTFLEETGTDKAADARAALAAIEDAIPKAWRAECSQRLTAIRQALDASTVPAPAKEALLAKAGAVEGEPDAGKQVTALNKLEAEVAVAVADDFASRLHAIKGTPREFEADKWTTLKSDTLSKLARIGEQPEGKRASTYNAVLHDYLLATLTALESYVKEKLAAVDLLPQLTADEKKNYAQQLNDVLKPITAQLAAAGNATAGAMTRVIDDARKQLQSLSIKAHASGKAPGFLSGGESASPGAGATPLAPALDFSGAIVGLITGLSNRGQRLADLSSSSLTKAINRLDLLVLGLGLLISILLGLKLLWVDNATWGSANDYLIAILWGLGLHQVSNAAFEGAAATVARIAK